MSTRSKAAGKGQADAEMREDFIDEEVYTDNEGDNGPTNDDQTNRPKL